MPSDIRAAQAREHHRQLEALQEEADRHREQRNRLIRVLRQSDPGRWTYASIAREVGIGVELVRAICNGRT